MAQKTRTELKALFEFGDTVSEAAFIDLIDSITVSKNGGGILVDFDNSLTITVPPTTSLSNTVIWVDTTQTIKIGSTVGGGEYYEEQITGGTSMTFGNIFSIAGQNVYISGSTGIHIKYYLI